jgi:hypothetical protein
MNFNNLDVKHGMFCQIDWCDIWFEVKKVHENALTIHDRDPNRVDDYVLKNRIIRIQTERPKYGHIIFSDGSRNYFDKFFKKSKFRME